MFVEQPIVFYPLFPSVLFCLVYCYWLRKAWNYLAPADFLFFLFIRLQCCLLSTSAYGTCAACWLWTVLSRSVKQAWGCLSLILTFLPLLVLLVEQSLLFYLGLQTDFYFLMSSFGLFIVIGFAWLGIICLMLTFSSYVLFISFQSCLWTSSAYETCSVVGFSMPFQAQGRKFEGA